jgi:hypothetical protein
MPFHLVRVARSFCSARERGISNDTPILSTIFLPQKDLLAV